MLKRSPCFYDPNSWSDWPLRGPPQDWASNIWQRGSTSKAIAYIPKEIYYFQMGTISKSGLSIVLITKPRFFFNPLLPFFLLLMHTLGWWWVYGLGWCGFMGGIGSGRGMSKASSFCFQPIEPGLTPFAKNMCLPVVTGKYVRLDGPIPRSSNINWQNANLFNDWARN